MRRLKLQCYKIRMNYSITSPDIDRNITATNTVYIMTNMLSLTVTRGILAQFAGTCAYLCLQLCNQSYAIVHPHNTSVKQRILSATNSSSTIHHSPKQKRENNILNDFGLVLIKCDKNSCAPPHMWLCNNNHKLVQPKSLTVCITQY